MEDYVFVSQLCEDQALCIKVQALWQGTAEGQLRDRMKCAQVAQGIPPRKKTQYGTRATLCGHQSPAHTTLVYIEPL